MTRADNTHKDGFILYRSHYESISQLTDEQLGRLLRLLFQWQIEGKIEKDPEGVVNMAASFIINQFKVDRAKYQERCEMNRVNGQKGGRPRKNQSVIKKPNGFEKNHNDNENDKEKENDKGKNVSHRKSGGQPLSLPYSSSEFVNTWNDLIQEPRWRKKTSRALKMSLNKLARIPEDFAIFCMQETIENGWPSVVYDGSEKRFQRWQQSHPESLPRFCNDDCMMSDDIDPYAPTTK